ncbi:MAG: NAD synthetase [Planctomycetes bacterium RIFCSPLOWO2_12_FULL_50_35]|nr:MAG: NAD synthetase [Planctomycetes bacterium RIFCSPLOWO2_12_FULL_50_35]
MTDVMLQTVDLSYLAAAVLFMLGLKKLSSPATARAGNGLSMLGMTIAVAATLFKQEILSFNLIIIGVVIGGVIGAVAAKRVQMTAMPEMIAILNGCGGGASAMVAVSEYHRLSPRFETFLLITLLLSVIVGTVTFTGSVIAFSKLRGIISGRPIVYTAQRASNWLLGIVVICLTIGVCLSPANISVFYGLTFLSLLLGVLLVIPIGGADMPVVISLLNSLSGVAVSMTGFVLSNNALIIVGSLVGAAGLILTRLMCEAMNRSLTNVLFGAFGAVGKGVDVAGAAAVAGTIKSYTVEDAATMLENAGTVIITPGYGMAVAQAQHAVRELASLLENKGVKVRYAIHPVAGRMPGHMNVLLAEANVPYDKLFAMEDINADFAHTDVALVVGANDVVNPAARNVPSSPIYGMPILNVDQAKTVIVLKRSMRPGFAGIENELFLKDNTMMVFGDAKETLQKIIAYIKG